MSEWDIKCSECGESNFSVGDRGTIKCSGCGTLVDGHAELANMDTAGPGEWNTKDTE